MIRRATLPFVIEREHGIVSGREVTSTKDALHGLLHLEGASLIIQWRTAREISRVGKEIRTDRELAPLREKTIPLSGVSGAQVRRGWHRWWFADELVLTAADLRAFEGLEGEGEAAGLVLEHPAEIVLRIRRADRERARDFASELRLAVSEIVLARLEVQHQQQMLSDGALREIDEGSRSEDEHLSPAGGRRERAL